MTMTSTLSRTNPDAIYCESFVACFCPAVLQHDLMVLATDGLPLWDGMADIQVRPAFPEEEARWRASRAKAIRHGYIETEDDTGSLFWLHSPISTAEEDDRAPAAALQFGAFTSRRRAY